MSSTSIISEHANPIAFNPIAFGGNRRLDDLAALVSQLVRGLEDLDVAIKRSAIEQLSADASDGSASVNLRLDIRSARRLRHLRRRLFGEGIDSGPSWDILLHLFESHVLERRDTVGNVTDGAELPGATALRWISRLEQEGLIVLRDDHLDRRRRYVELSGSGVELMTRYFSGAAPHLIAA